MIAISKWIIIFFGLFIIVAGLIMLFAPSRAREILRKAGSTNFINYGEITLRMITAIAIILYSDFSKYPDIFYTFGWFMLITSFILYVVPRKLHHSFSVKCADLIKPFYFQIISPFSFLFGSVIIYCVL